MYEARLPHHIAYFSMELALENTMPTYAGGLGVLAGDTLLRRGFRPADGGGEPALSNSTNLSSLASPTRDWFSSRRVEAPRPVYSRAFAAG
jgi:hypothetical protein